MLIGHGGRIFEIQTVASLGHDESLIALRVGDECLDARGNAGDRRVTGCQTVAAAEGHVTLTGDDEDRAGELTDAANGTADGEQFADRDGLAEDT